ncbi:MAG TPA: FAD-binding oxidoreductase [Actinomycetes bacterium]|nr:FAD-binding oxidoreductase [Actinomycetes bacterium]
MSLPAARRTSPTAADPHDAERRTRPALPGRFTGPSHLPGGAGYDEQRRSLNPAVDSRPAVVIEAGRAADVRAAVVAARELDVPFAVQATGHGTHVPTDGGILLKTSALAAVLVDPARRIARVGPGARWGDVLTAAAPFGLAPLSGSATSVGVTGYTLGGGVGWLARRYGFAADSVLRAHVVTADGRLVTASREHNPELFWALRGGGGNFGVVTSLEFRLYPVARVYAGALYFPIDTAAETMARYRDWVDTVPDELSTALLLREMPDSPDIAEPIRGRRVLTIKAMYAGAAAPAERLLQPLRSIAGPALVDALRPIRYADAAMGGTAARHLDLYRRLPDTVLESLLSAYTEPGSTVANIEIRHWGGAMARPAADAGPVGHRSAPFSVIVDGRDPELIERLRPHGVGGSFLNFLTDPTRTASAYTAADYRKLREVKAQYDPDNFFRVNHNIPPAR